MEVIWSRAFRSRYTLWGWPGFGKRNITGHIDQSSSLLLRMLSWVTNSFLFSLLVCSLSSLFSFLAPSLLFSCLLSSLYLSLFLSLLLSRLFSCLLSLLFSCVFSAFVSSLFFFCLYSFPQSTSGFGGLRFLRVWKAKQGKARAVNPNPWVAVLDRAGASRGTCCL